MHNRQKGVLILHAGKQPELSGALFALESRDLLSDKQLHALKSRHSTELVCDYEFAVQIVEVLAEANSITFELSLFGQAGLDGVRFVYVPGLGLKNHQIDSAGNKVLNEFVLARITTLPSAVAIKRALDEALAISWDLEIEALAQESWLIQERLVG